ncbi:MAG: hypothetical protein DSZ31_01675 [Gammaproteobacteria bacterium]|nr:MAG: hypothetical protein DSZ31_01675 [Gammaproteobacteria bacterium]
MAGKKLFIAGLFTVGIGYAQTWNLSLQPYFTYINYSNSGVKKNGYSSTIYGVLSIDRGTHVVEGAIGYTHLRYKGNASWNQSDYTLAYTNYMFYPWYAKLGFHYIATPNNHFSEKSKIYFGDVGYISKYKWDAGVFVSYSDYKRSVSTFESRLHSGFYRWKDYYSGFYFSCDLTWINLDDSKKVLTISKNNYYSAGIGVTYFTPQYKVGAYGWLGERTLMVDNGGFVVYNLEEKYKGGLNLSGVYYITKKLWVEAQAGYSQYKESETGKNVGVLTTTLSVGYAF